MITTITKVTVLATAMAFSAAANAQTPNVRFSFGQTTTTTSQRVVHKQVQRTPEYSMRRAEVASGARVTLFANFLEQRAGKVVIQVATGSLECKLLDWRNNSVTAELPPMGLRGPQPAWIHIIKPNGQIAKSYPVLYVPQPDIVVHGESIPQPMPATGHASPASFALPGGGALAR